MTRFALLLRRPAAALIAAATLLAPGPALAATTGSGKALSETRAVSGFQAIALPGSIDVVVRQASSEGVQVRADDNVLPLVQTIVEGSGDTRTLRIQFKAGVSVHSGIRSLLLPPMCAA